MKRYLLIVVLIILCSLFYFLFSNNISYSSLKDEFIINKPYLNVVKSLATKNSLEKAIEEDEGRLISKHWDSFVLEVPKRILRIRDYKLEGTLYFTVEKYDSSLGLLNLDFNQKVKIDKDIFLINIFLVNSKSEISLYNKFIEIMPATEYSSKIFIKSDLKVKKLIPYFLKQYMDDKVDESNKRDLLKLKTNILKIIEDTNTGFKINVK